ncbi:MAG TPA: TlpA disulfide reductase family protein [Blastocatellia bacterium]|nr:TlpA disulfide reductase family protein [Blastocatellia bacterium]
MPSLRPTAQEQKEKQEEEHEYAPIVASNLDYHDFSYKTLDGKPVSLREYLDGKRLVIVDYAAAWCKNTNYNGPVVKRLYDKYKDRGLGVVVVMEYSDPEEIRIHINRIGIDYPVVIETKSREEREKSTHYKYRSGVGDKRKWGTPFYVLIDSRDVVPPVPQLPVAVRVYTASGELIETEAERFIELHLAR